MVTDKLGRKLEVKALSIVDQFDLLEAAQNQARYEYWFSLASIVFSCLSIDGVPLPKPRKPDDFKKNIGLLKDEGIEAILENLDHDVEEQGSEAALDSEKNS